MIFGVLLWELAKKMQKAGRFATTLGLCVLGGCAVTTSFVIAGAAYRIGLELLVAFLVTANGGPVRQAARVDLEFPSQPADRPAGASFSLDARSVQATPLNVAKSEALQQSVNGLAALDVLVAASTEVNPCTGGTLAGQFSFSFDGTNVTMQQGSFELPSTAFDFVRTGSFSLCLGLSANANASITISEIGVNFGPDSSSCPTGSACDPDAVSCINGFCPFGAICDDSERCVASDCSVLGSCPPFTVCEQGKCVLFDCVVDTVEVCSLMGLTCSDGKCMPHPCTDNECPFGTGCNDFNQCVPIDCDLQNDCPPSLTCSIGAGICAEIQCPPGLDCPPPLHCEDELCIPTACESDFDCAASKEVCNAFGQCVPLQCQELQCPYGMECDDFGQCLPLACDPQQVSCPIWMFCHSDRRVCVELPCDPDGTCPRTSFSCEEGVCVPYRCQAGTCPLGMECNAFGECVPFACVESECPVGLECYEPRGLCLQFPCTSKACPSTLVCDETTKLCVARECSIDGDCPSKLRCVEGHCVAQFCEQPGSACPSGTICNAFNQCAPPEVCPPDSKCETACVSDLDCPSGEGCVNGDCAAVVEDCDFFFHCDAECVGDSDCPEGLACNDAFVCYDPSNIQCVFDSDCPAGQSCDARFQCN